MNQPQRKRVVEKLVTLDEDNVAWFTTQYPKASLSGTLDLLLAKFREASKMTPQDYARIAADALKLDLNGS